jgi:DNA-binding MarR family transcriptional regulator
MVTTATAVDGEVARPRVRTRSRRSAAPASAAAPERAPDARVDLGPLPRLLGYNLRRAHQISWRTYVGVIGEQKLRPGLFSLLMLAQCNPGICQIDLGKHLGVDKASMVALLDRLERAGVIERRRSTRDRRRQGIFLTVAGGRELEGLMRSVRRLERQMASRYTRAELEQFLDFLQRFYS